MIRLSQPEWREQEAAHADRADALTAGHRARAARAETHPIEDFLFTYYSYKPAVLRRWHPGAQVELAEGRAERGTWRWYAAEHGSDAVHVDAAAFLRERRALVEQVARILSRTAARPAQFGCFGLHEWAMVFRADERRHAVPLRLGREGTDAVVESHDLKCTHFDAFRFFTPDAVPRNREMLSRDTQADREQPGCLHAGMDVYKWAVKLGPLAPGDVLLDAFELARDIRYLDMQASPYDMRAWGAAPVPIETTQGKTEYVRRQREFADRSNALRRRLLDAVETARTAATASV